MSDNSPSKSPFLGGGPRFNQAGNNTPLPGEHRAETPPPPPFGGPKVWAGVLIIVTLLVVLYFVYGNAGFLANGPHAPVSPIKPDINPDSPQ
jgi:hypothetical protein